MKVTGFISKHLQPPSMWVWCSLSSS